MAAGYEVDWGSLPDWLSAVGSLGAVGAALLLGAFDRRRAARAERALLASQGDLAEEAQFIAHVIGIHTEAIYEQCKLALPQPEAINEWRKSLARSHRIVSDLQALKPATPALVVAISHLIEATVPEPLDLGSADEFETIAADVFRRLALIRFANKALEQLRPTFPATTGERQS